jgi:hypothetical protein
MLFLMGTMVSLLIPFTEQGNLRVIFHDDLPRMSAYNRTVFEKGYEVSPYQQNAISLSITMAIKTINLYDDFVLLYCSNSQIERQHYVRKIFEGHELSLRERRINPTLQSLGEG